MQDGDGKFQELVKRFNLPPLPKVACTLMQMLGDPDVSVHDLAGVISVEPALASRLIRLANSSYFGQRHMATTVERAAVVLGLNYVKALCLANQLAAPLSQIRFTGLDPEHFWRDALLRGCIGRQVARRCPGADAEHAFLVGLLMDVGIPSLLEADDGTYAAAFEQLGAFQLRLADWEREHLGFTHADLAAAQLAEWNVPDVLTSAIRAHHAASGPPGRDAALMLQCISYFVGGIPLGASMPIEGGADAHSSIGQAARLIGLDPDAIGTILNASRNECETIAGLFDTLLPATCDIKGVLSEACHCLAAADPEMFAAAFG